MVYHIPAVSHLYSMIQFMAAYVNATNKDGVFSEETFLPVRAPHGDTMRLKHKPMPHGKTLVRF